MKRMISIFAYTWAFLMVPLVLVTFMKMDVLAGKLVTITGLKVSPKFTGGDIARTIEHQGYSTAIHVPVFEGLLRPCAEGFVQIDWIDWKSGNGRLPDVITENIDYNGDNTSDVSVEIDTRTNKLTFKSDNPSVIGPDEVIRIATGRMLRIRLGNGR